MDEKRVSKLLSLVLRHDPKKLGLTLDPNGWVPVEELLMQLAKKGYRLSREQLEHLVATNDKQRFGYNQDRTRIRANQGHSVEVELDLAPSVPPAILYHGTAMKNRGIIESEGLKKMKRQHVHLSSDWETAVKVGSRHGKPIVFVVDTQAMATTGALFYRSENGVWLVESVPPQFLKLMEG
ncbi:MAG: RNA 2'-phosphotransferase [Candidatus Sumerlaeia bacterium]|nr:RNA 2'-phosphotransferase [Candidatus Sumerlaeia bacterium]